VKCHGRGRSKGGFSLETRDAMLEGGDSGPAIAPGASQNSHLIALVAGLDPDLVMPQKGTRLKPEQIGLLRAWIDQGAPWDASVNFAKSEPRNIEPRQPSLPPLPAKLAVSHAPTNAASRSSTSTSASSGGSANPIDRLLAPYLAAHGVTPGPRITDRQFARRLYLDTIGLLPTPDELRAFLADRRPDKRTRLVQQLLADRRRYAEHWLSFWNDVLRNDYRGPGFIDGGRQQITAWLYQSLLDNVPYDRFVSQLINPTPGAGAEGFTKGIIWRGVVNASQTPPMQAAQNVSQVFMGVNLKCASCHDSFINDWQLADAYGLASLYAEAPLEMVECDRPTGRMAQAKFLYAKLGSIDAKAARADRLRRLSDIVISHQNGRLSRTIVNRLWARFMGRGLVEPVDDMEQPAWHPDLLDWLAEDLVSHGYDLKHTMTQILTSRAYQSAATNAANDAAPASAPAPAPAAAPTPAPGPAIAPAAASASASASEANVFRGPSIRRMSAEQFADAVSAVTGVWQGLPAGDFDFTTLLRQDLPRLRGQWVWSTRGTWSTPAPQTAADADVMFRKTFELQGLPRFARALVAYDGPLVVYVNGRKVADAGASSTPRLIDIRAALRSGQNLIAIAAKRPPTLQQTLLAQPASAAPPQAQGVTQLASTQPASARPAMPGLFVEVLVRPDANRSVGAGPCAQPRARCDQPMLTAAATDSTWRCRVMNSAAETIAAASATAAAAPTARALPAWAEAHVDEAAWTPAVASGDMTSAPPPVVRALTRAAAIASVEGRARAALVAADPLTTALGRPNREQVVTTRSTAATTLQALELSNGVTLTRMLQRGAGQLLAAKPAPTRDALIARLYLRALGRAPTPAEAKACRELLGPNATPTPDAVQDLLWAVVMLSEFQLIY
jgi:hypothetical protein